GPADISIRAIGNQCVCDPLKKIGHYAVLDIIVFYFISKCYNQTKADSVQNRTVRMHETG
ncbi:MAG: hypothetical protein ACR2NK_14785, partial [Mariniblastus sp.]